MTSRIPDKGQVTVRSYGLYANARRGKVRKAGIEAFPLRIDAFLTEVAVVDRIIDHLKLTFFAERPPPECAFQNLLVADPPAEYFP